MAAGPWGGPVRRALLAGLLALLPWAASAHPAIAQADALLNRASATLQGPPQPSAWADVRAAQALFARTPRLTARERALGASRAAQLSSWLYTSEGNHPAARARGRAALRLALRWQPADGAEVLGARQALFSQAVTRGQWKQAQAELAALQPWMPADDACDDPVCALVLLHRSQMHSALGDAARAYAERERVYALALRRNDGPELAWDALSLAHLARMLQRPEDEKRWLQDVLQRAERGGVAADHPAVVQAGTSYATLLAAEGGSALATARTQAQRNTAALEAARGPIDRDRAGLLLSEAALSHQAGDLDAVRREAAEALAIGWAIDEPTTAWQAIQRLVFVAEQTDDARGEALYGKALVNALQQQRLRLQDSPAEAQQHFIQRLLQSYENLADTLVRQQRLPEAEQVLALVRDGAYHALVRSAPPMRLLPLTPNEQTVEQQLAAQRTALAQATVRWNQAGRPRGDGEAGVRQALAQTVDAVLTLPGAAVTTAPALATPPDTPAAPAGDAPRVLYLPGPQTLRIAVQHGGTSTVRDVPLREERLLEQLAALRRTLQNPASDPRPQAQVLYQQLWAPIADLLPPGAPGDAPLVRIHPEGALRYLPFGVLFDGTHWLAERATLALDGGEVSDAEGTPDTPPRNAPARHGWALLGASRGAGLPALPQVPAELRAIQREAPGGPASTRVALDGAFTPQRLQTALARQRVVHIASHFVLAPTDPGAGWLQLGAGRRVTLQALAGPAYRFDGLDLLTLSACETAVPTGPQGDGTPLESLAWLAHARGARNVLASLWSIPDQTTGALMQDFYRALAAGQPAASALQQAQRAMRERAATAEGAPSAMAVRGLRPASTSHGPEDASTALQGTRHPYYWGAFVVLSRPESAPVALPKSELSAQMQ